MLSNTIAQTKQQELKGQALGFKRTQTNVPNGKN
jgi:hypothetical protein